MNNYKDILPKFYQRCKLKPGYKVAVYLKDTAKLEKLAALSEDWASSSNFAENLDNETGIRRVKGVKFGFNSQGKRAKFDFANGSEMILGVYNHFSPEEKYHARLFDHAMSWDECKKYLGIAIPYKEIDYDSVIFNPDPIAISIKDDILEGSTDVDE